MSVDTTLPQMTMASERVSQEPPTSTPGFGQGDGVLLLTLSIGKRLTLGFLVPMLIVSLGLVSISVQSNRLLTNVSTFNQHLLHAYTSLTSASDTLVLTHTNLLATLADADKIPVNPETLREDQQVMQGLVATYETHLTTSRCLGRNRAERGETI